LINNKKSVYSLFTKQNIMAKYSKNAQDKIEEVMHEFKEGTLKSGKNGKVTNRKQAIAIGISEAKEAGFKVPVQKEDK
jgi:hypothetical protein